MSKSLKRVKAALAAFGIPDDVMEMPGETRTAADAAREAGCTLDQIAKSIIFADAGGAAVLFLTAGGNRVDGDKAAALTSGPLSKADAGLVRAQTGFAIGGVSPVGHLNPIRAWMDPRLLEFDKIWAAAGTPHHVFAAHPEKIREICNAQISDFTA